MKSTIYHITLFILLTGCIETQSSKGYKKTSLDNYNPPEKDIDVDSNTVFSVFRTPLPAKKLSAEKQKSLNRKLEINKLRYTENPSDIQNVIEYCQTLSELGWYYEAIRVYSEGLDKNPTSFKLLRLRGQSYITLRQFDLALEDLQRAAFYSRPAINEQTSGYALTNFYTESRSNEKFNIFFCLGMVNYLKGSYDKTISSFKQCMKYADNIELKVFIIDWFYLTYRKLGNNEAAEELLMAIPRNAKVKSYSDHYNRILLYQGVVKAHNLMAYSERPDNSLEPVLSYGVGTWYLVNGEKMKAVKIFERILMGETWDSYEYIAAEVELKNLQPN
ncbi:M48 family metallopeptidase [Marinoscillum sp. MHG1-6]|uniref:tetratricopeptide repeat protein n=1 Tax=Marinoscillum sp. MHG1-6 TaxID=2959627 RepID=UPI002157A13B|nr:hypothetical protein [Marinoscillum sp. MHG1-6]